MPQEDVPFTREEVVEAFCQQGPTDPEALRWEPVLGIFKGTLRLRLNVTEANISEPLVDVYRYTKYPATDVPEIEGLRAALASACGAAGVRCDVEPGSRELQTAAVAFFEPWKFRLPFQKAKLSLVIAPGELQWILQGASKEPDRQRLSALQQAILAGTRDWIRRGNR